MNKDYLLRDHLIVQEDSVERMDVYLSHKYTQFTRSFIHKLILEGHIHLNGENVKPSTKPTTGDRIEILIPPLMDIDARPQDIPLDIIYQDTHIAVINKPKGMVVHPAAGNYENTLVNALLFHVSDLSGINGAFRPGIVHRLDKDTSGLIVVAKTDMAHKHLSQQIKEKSAYRVYLAIVHGNLKNDEGIINAPIGRHKTERKMMAVVPGGRPAVTHYRVLERFHGFTLIEARLETGRTHQIRVHMKHIGHPVAGDVAYGPKKTALTKSGQLLHAYKLGIIHPETGEAMVFEVPPDEAFAKALNHLKILY
jgi:23S rRNA pseudouridine1911/1915/1917 synthase